MAATNTVIKTTCPRDCYDACGMTVIMGEAGIEKVTGDPDHPFTRGSLCGKCMLAYNGVFQDRSARLQTPLRRSGPKGSGQFEPVSWEEALGAIAAKFTEIAADDPSHVLHAHYTGTCSLIANNFPMRFFNKLGATEVEPDSVCNMAGHVALGYVIGTSLVGFDPRTAKDASSIFVWGANPSATAPHAHQYWLKESGAKIVVVDPVRHATADRADLYLQPRPGSDAALAFAIMHVLARDGALDQNFIDANTVGWDELEPMLGDCTPEWGEQATGVPAADIEQAAAIYGAGPAMLWLGQGLQRQRTGGNVIRACSLLPAITGNYGKPGTGLLYLNGGGRKGVDGGYLSGSHLGDSPPSVSHMDLAARLEQGDKSKAFVCWNINPAASNPEQVRLQKALSNDDLFTVVVELFQTDTADYADYVLPAASFLEFDDLVSGYFNLSFSAQAKAAEPQGDSLPNQEIFRRLSRAMGYDEPDLYESDTDMMDRTVESVGVAGGYAALKAAGTIWPGSDPIMQFADFKFPTPSGKIEIASAAAGADGFPRVPQPSVDAGSGKSRLRLITPASRWLMNDSYANDAGVTRKLGAASVTINPADAKSLGLSDGQEVRLSNDTGALDMVLEVSDVVAPGVALSHKGRWPAREGAGRANVNTLNSGEKSDMGESSAVHNVEVSIAAR